MITCKQLTDISTYPNIAVALGTFDGLHAGHQHIIGHAVSLAKKTSGTSVVLTFSNHPLSVIDPSRCPPLLLSEQDKQVCIENMGIDILLSIPFTNDFLKLTPAEFIDILVTNLQPAYIVVGPNYFFGYKGLGTPETLREAGRSCGFEVQVPEAVNIHNRLASSTLIRQLIAAGKVEEATQYLRRQFSLTGVVTTGDGRGRHLGYPTANIVIPEGMASPANGVYAVEVQTHNECLRGVANIGYNPTFDGKSRRLEVFILDYHGDLYGQELRIIFYFRLRGEICFSGAASLQEQIQQDIHTARQLFK